MDVAQPFGTCYLQFRGEGSPDPDTGLAEREASFISSFVPSLPSPTPQLQCHNLHCRAFSHWYTL